MAGNKQLPVVEIPAELKTLEQVKEFIHKTITRRDFNKAMGVAGLGAIAFQFGCSSDTANVTPRQVYVADAKGMVVADPTLCGGCRRCEMACTGFNLGQAQPTYSNIKVNRNLLYGAKDVGAGLRVDGIYGNFRVVQDTCRQCPHPVPCQTACPNDAIHVEETTGARVVNEEECKGCGICAAACPWEMISLNGELLNGTTKARKCTLCADSLAAGQERPNCVEACINGALQYVPWTDRTGEVPKRQAGSGVIAAEIEDSCAQCH
ncbi:MAG TPA: 4Fe-4S dicluster domain-containing protein [Anaeromyxobacteraceae bacterium]|nr:4Fe-4S dicluster domain-containing protein [Anaeromyxobacteraceae bacterium]